MKASHIMTGIVALLAGFWLGRIQIAGREPGKESRGEIPAGASSVASAAESDSSAASRNSRPLAAAVSDGAKLAEELHQTFLIGNPITRSLKFAELLEEMTPQNAREFRELFFGFDKQGLRYDSEWRLLWHQWGKVDPLAAMAALKEEGSNGRSASYAASVLELIFSSWSEIDSAAASKHLSQLTDPDQYNRAYFGLLRGMDLESASRFAEQTSFPEGTTASSAAERLVERALRESGSTDDMKSWYDGLSTHDFKQAAIDHVYWRLKQADLGASAAWVGEQTVAGMDTRRINGELVADFVKADPLKGLDWYLSLPEPVRDAAEIQRLTEAAAENPESFQEWRSKSPVAGLIPAGDRQ
ncbi:hypothetical protein OKA05_05535 [Luteolibacter arcticus]|uniref:DUF4034 domain-containing protein n=1 Tax=Luteolibacter arcticus TaxID=1581411 RepID=A0ABT3GEG3_9BACT|nr:hypothetical protein [Luteolibacter arcticus]MCW1922004.1 hypothetical protein [Luteolibacter arcticus]